MQQTRRQSQLDNQFQSAPDREAGRCFAFFDLAHSVRPVSIRARP